ncbi:MAG TPA: hypothetical protein VIX80_06680 [Candidatus Kapabacteria bacterium]
MNRFLLILILLFGATVFTACTEEPTSPTNTTPGKLLIQPTSLNGVLNQEYTFKAKVENVSFGDIRFLWDFGDGNFRNFSSQEVLFKFNYTGSFFVRVKAYDYFTDELLGFDSIPVTISGSTSNVQIVPPSIDSVINYYDDASFQIPITLRVTSTSAVSNSKVIWHYSDGTKSDTIESSFEVYHVFQKIGDYTVRTEVYEKNGNFVGADTATVKLRFPPLTMSMIQSSKQVSVFLMLDRTSVFFDQPGFYNPSAYGAMLSNAPNKTITWTSNSLAITEDVDSSTSFGSALKDRKLTVGFSTDLKKVTTLSLSVHDSTQWQDGSKHDYAEFSYTLQNIELIAITENEIVYRAVVPTTTMVAPDLQYNSSPPHTSQAGDFADPMGYIYQFSSNPEFSQAIIVFTR